MRSFSCVVCTVVLLLPACDGLGPPGAAHPSDDTNYISPSSGNFIESPPSPDELQQQIGTLLEEARAAVPESVRDPIEAQAESYPAPGSGAKGPHPCADPISLRLEPATSGDFFAMVGAEAVFLGSLSTATWAFLEAAALDPTSAFFLSQAGFALNAGGRYADARPLLLAARAADEAFYPAHLNLGAAYEGLEDWWRAIGELQMVVYLQPRNWTFLAWLARLYAQVGMTAVARGLLESAVEMAPDDPDLQAELDALPPDDGPPPGDPLSPTVSQPSDASGLVAWAAMVQCVPTVFGADMQSWIEAGIRYEAAEGEVEDAFHDENWEQLVCEGQCPEWPLEAEHACEQQCRVANCSAHQASLASGLPPMFGENAAEQAACTRVQNDHLACLMSAFGRIGDTLSATATQFFLEYVDTAMADWAHTCQGEIPATLREEVAALSQDVAMTCDNAATPFDAVDADDALSQSDRFTNVELCLDGLVCVDLADGGITIEVEGELLAGEVTLDFDTGDFGFGFGLGVSDPTGLFQASVLLKFHTARGIGISGEARAGGPLSAKLGVDFWAFTN